MLGMNSQRELVKGKFAKEVRLALWRSLTGNLNEKELECKKKDEAVRKKYTASWS